MRLLTHNMLQCHVKGCNSNNFPLSLSDVEMSTLDSETTPEFIKGLIPRLDYAALYKTCQSIGIEIPAALPDDPSEDFLESLGQVLLKCKIMNGNMKCDGCGHVYPIKDGIPNMLLHETEV